MSIILQFQIFLSIFPTNLLENPYSMDMAIMDSYLRRPHVRLDLQTHLFYCKISYYSFRKPLFFNGLVPLKTSHTPQPSNSFSYCLFPVLCNKVLLLAIAFITGLMHLDHRRLRQTKVVIKMGQ